MPETKANLASAGKPARASGQEPPAEGTVFDSVYKTLVHKAPQLIVPLINEMFGKDYPDSALVIHLSNEHEGPQGSRISDSVFQLQDRVYHVECQSTADNNMVIRMIEYDFAIALEGALGSGAPYEIDFPASCVLFLRHDDGTPDSLQMKVRLPDGGSFDYTTRVVKAQQFSSEDIFARRLLILLLILVIPALIRSVLIVIVFFFYGILHIIIVVIVIIL